MVDRDPRRRRTWRVVAGSLAMAVVMALQTAAPASAADPPAGPCSYTQQRDVPAKMRDGVTLLRPNVYPPQARRQLSRHPHAPALQQGRGPSLVYAPPEFYASHCYVVVVQDVRGQYASEGSSILHRRGHDGYDTIEWAARLPGHGRVGMYGSLIRGPRSGCPPRRRRRPPLDRSGDGSSTTTTAGPTRAVRSNWPSARTGR